MSDTTKHLKYFKIENFKRFEKLEMENLGQFNLIVGDNNVGKTSVLEALLVERNARKSINSLATVLSYRKVSNNVKYSDFTLFSNKSLTNKNLFSIKFFLGSVDESPAQLIFNRDKYSFEFTAGVLENADNHLTEHINNECGISDYYKVPLIPFGRGYEIKLPQFYKVLQESKALKQRFIESLRLMVPSLSIIEPDALDRDKLIFYQDDLDYSLPLEMFGDGTLKLFRILAEIIVHNGNRLMIDEVETGIHYSRLKDFWKVIIRSAKENDVQLFMTTHNKECIQAFVEILSDSDMKEFREDARNVTLVESKDKSVKAFTYQFDELEHAITLGNEVRS